jgi:hypothetical protein
MKVELIDAMGGIRDREGALKYCQNFARVCYSEKDFDEVRKEPYNVKLVEGRLIKIGHHSVFDHFCLSLSFTGLPKAMAMTLNDEPPYATSEKSARYTTMRKDMEERQGLLYDKWNQIFRSEISNRFPESKFPSLYKKGNDGKTTEQKLAQENARYVTSVFTPTMMGYTLSLRQLNVLASEFEKFESEIGGDLFKQRMFEEGMIPFLNSDVIKEFRIKELKSKSRTGTKLFGKRVEEHFGEDIYSTNFGVSLACLAQNQRHRTVHNSMVDGWELGAPLGYFIPPIIRETDLERVWIKDLDSVSEFDFPQGQIIEISERGNREDLEMKLRERNCGLPQLEIVRAMDDLLERYSKSVPEMGGLRGATCLVEGTGCEKGGCTFGPEAAVSRLI